MNILHCIGNKMRFAVLTFCIILVIRKSHSEDLCKEPANCTDQYCVSLVSNATYRQVLFDEIRFLKTMLQRLTAAGLTSIKPEHLNRTLQLASSPEVETGTLEFTRQHLLNAILENPAARNELEYVYVSRQATFSRIVQEFKNRIRQFEEKMKIGNKDSHTNWDLLIKVFDQCKKNEVNEYMIRAEIAEFMNYERWNILAVNFIEDLKTSKFC